MELITESAGFDRLPEHLKENSLSPSGTVQVAHSAQHYEANYILDEREEPTPAMEEGTMIHMRFLEPEKFKETYAIMPKLSDYPGALRTQADLIAMCKKLELKVGGTKPVLTARLKEAGPSLVFWDEIVAGATAGKKVVTEKQEIGMSRIERQIKKHPHANGLIFGGTAEQEIYGHFYHELAKVHIRFRIDRLYTGKSGRRIVIDLKTTTATTLKEFQIQIYKLKLHVLASLYVDGVKAITGQEPLFVWVAVQSKSPFIVNTFVADTACLEAGRIEAFHAIELWKECKKSKNWPGPDAGLIPATLPHWAWSELEYETRSENA